MARSTRRQESPLEAEPGNASEAPIQPVIASSSGDHKAGSDKEVEEKPVREKLKKTSIANTEQDAGEQDDVTTNKSEELPTANADSDSSSKEGSRGRIRKKRSFEDFDEDQMLDPSQKTERHARKKSRDHGGDMSSGSSSRKVSGEYTFEKIEEGDDDDAIIVDRAEEKNEPSRSDIPQPLKLARPSTPPSGDIKDEDMVTSPKNKRNRDEFLLDEEQNSKSTEKEHKMDIKDATTAESEHETGKKTNGDEPHPKRARDSPKPISPPAETSPKESESASKGGFGNSSATSPFSALSGRKSPTLSAQTSASAFAASGFSSLAASATSGFGSLGGGESSSKSGFGSVADSKPSAFSSAGTGSGFGSLGSTTKSSFASTGASTNGPSTSGFGSLQKGSGSGFGAGFVAAPGPRLSSFASGEGGKITGLSDKTAKPFGAAAEDEESEEVSGDDEEATAERLKSPPLEEDRKDKRFFEQELETGEENESTVFSCRAKLYNFDSDKREWKERGVGVIKINVQDVTLEDLESKAAPKARFVMRADGSHRVVLNTPIKKGIKVEAPGKPDEKPTGGLLAFLGSIDNKPQLESLQLRVKPANAEQLWQKVKDLQADM